MLTPAEIRRKSQKTTVYKCCSKIFTNFVSIDQITRNVIRMTLSLLHLKIYFSWYMTQNFFWCRRKRKNTRNRFFFNNSTLTLSWRRPSSYRNYMITASVMKGLITRNLKSVLFKKITFWVTFDYSFLWDLKQGFCKILQELWSSTQHVFLLTIIFATRTVVSFNQPSIYPTCCCKWNELHLPFNFNPRSLLIAA